MKQKNMLHYWVIIINQVKWYEASYKIFNKNYEKKKK